MKFEIYRSGEEWGWRLKARNGEIIAVGEGYKNKADCLATIDLLQSKDTETAPIVEVDS